MLDFSEIVVPDLSMTHSIRVPNVSITNKITASQWNKLNVLAKTFRSTSEISDLNPHAAVFVSNERMKVFELNVWSFMGLLLV